MESNIRRIIAASAAIIIVGFSSSAYAKGNTQKEKTAVKAQPAVSETHKCKGMEMGEPGMGNMMGHDMGGMKGDSDMPGMAGGHGMGGMMMGGPGMNMGPGMGMGKDGKCEGCKMMEMMVGPYAGLVTIPDDPMLAAKLGLTLDQKDKIHGIVFTNAKAAIRAKADLDIANMELKDLLTNDSPSLKNIESLIDDVSAKQGAIKKLAFRSQFEIKNVLTMEQLEKFNAMRNEMQCPMMKMKMMNQKNEAGTPDAKKGKPSSEKGKGMSGMDSMHHNMD